MDQLGSSGRDLRGSPEPTDLAILALLADGSTVEAAARRLEISERTVRRRLRSLADQIGVSTTMEVVVWAVRRDLV